MLALTALERGDLALRDRARLEEEKRTGKIIERMNPNSKWMLKERETHRSVAKHWLQELNYILQFSRQRRRFKGD